VLGTPEFAVVRVITVLVIACPHALGLAIPLVVSIATERAARGGVLIKDRLALERMRTVDAVLFDKTGTLTKRWSPSPPSTGAPRTRSLRWPRPWRPTVSTRWPGRSSGPPRSAACTCPRPPASKQPPRSGSARTSTGLRSPSVAPRYSTNAAPSRWT
jgi:hypothetical protein